MVIYQIDPLDQVKINRKKNSLLTIIQLKISDNSTSNSLVGDIFYVPSDLVTESIRRRKSNRWTSDKHNTHRKQRVNITSDLFVSK